MPLHTDYRPESLHQIIGNRETVSALKSHLTKQKPNRSLLFVGNSGCGKTTLAVCIARQVIQTEDERIFNANFTLLNASDFRGIDTVREVREAASHRPLGAAMARIWLYDECHKLSPDAQEAMLKLLEDPPRDCWFLLATTNPEKLKVTLKRRCTEFQVSPVSDSEMQELLKQIIRKERGRVPQEIQTQIIRDAMGSPGMALNILDKVIDLPSEEMAIAAKRWSERASNVVFLGKTLLDLHRNGKKEKGTWKQMLCPILQQFDDEDQESIRRACYEYFRKVFIGGDESVYALMACFSVPYYDVGKGLAASVYEAFCAE